MINEETNKQAENKIWDKWLSFAPHIEPISFEAYLDKHKPQKKLNKFDKARIKERAENIQRRLKN